MIDQFLYRPDYQFLFKMMARYLDGMRAHYPRPIEEGSKQDSYRTLLCTNSGTLQVQKNPPHKIHWQEYGNPYGEPVIVLHGGPGARSDSDVTSIFNSDRYRVILFDQRGCGGNEPNGSDWDATPALTDNTTPHLIGDIVKLREELGVKGKMHLFGGSWGTTLALAYAIQHPETVQTIVMRAAFLSSREYVDYFFQGNAADFERSPYAMTAPGAYLRPTLWKAWRRYVRTIPPEERGDMVAAYAKRLAIVPRTDEEKDELLKAAQAVADWDSSVMSLHSGRSGADDEVILRKCRIMVHYMMNDPLFGRAAGNYILENIGKLNGISLYIVQGANDENCPPIQAKMLEQAALKAGNESVNLIIAERGGHGGSETSMHTALTRIMNNLPMMSRLDLNRHWYYRLSAQKMAAL